MLLNRFFRLEMVKGDPNHHPRTLNAPFRAARHPGVQNNKTGSIHVCGSIHVRTPVMPLCSVFFIVGVTIHVNAECDEVNEQKR